MNNKSKRPKARCPYCKETAHIVSYFEGGRYFSCYNPDCAFLSPARPSVALVRADLKLIKQSLKKPRVSHKILPVPFKLTSLKTGIVWAVYYQVADDRYFGIVIESGKTDYRVSQPSSDVTLNDSNRKEFDIQPLS